MAFALKCFVALFVLSMASQGLCRCTFEKIFPGTQRTGREIAGKPVWKVIIINGCKCFQKDVALSCGGFAPAKPVNQSMLLPQGNTCLLMNGAALPPCGSVDFEYVGEPYDFKPVSSTVDPSCKT